MRKHLSLLLLVFALAASLSVHGEKKYPADYDTAFDKASGIPTIALDSNRIANLTNLGMLWGFIKYYHADVAAGKYNMDAELFRVLPKVLAAKSALQANVVMEHWVDHFGVPKGSNKTYDSADVKFYPDYGNLFKERNFSSTMVAKLNFIKTHRNTKDGHYYISLMPFVGNPFFNERSYDNMDFNDAGMRLLALFRYWNAIQYFHPDRHLIPVDWNNALASAIPAFCKADDTVGYYRALQMVIAKIADGHAINARGGPPVANKGFYTPITAMFADGKLVVTNCHDTLGVSKLIRPGAIIEQIDGITIDSLERRYRPTVSVSNNTAFLEHICRPVGALFKTEHPWIDLKIRYANDSLQEVRLPTLPFTARTILKNLYTSDTGYKLLPGNIGYVYAALLKNINSDSLINYLNNTKGLVFDLRCYPNASIPYTYGAWLKSRKSEFCWHTNMCIDMPGMCLYGTKGINGKDAGDSYKGKVVILVNEHSQSASEYSAIALASAPGAVVVGDTTAGADGNVSIIYMPGGGSTMISGIGVLYPDGRETQRVGVKIDKLVRPTVEGIRAGKDEQLEAAIDIINAQ